MKTNQTTAAADSFEKNKEVDTMTSFFMGAAQMYLTDETKGMSQAICARLDHPNESEQSLLFALVSGFLIGMEKCTEILEILNRTNP